MMEIDATSFEAEVQQAGKDLSPARAGLLFARECAYAELHPSDYLVALDDLALAAHPALARHAGQLERALALADYLFRQLGFGGNRSEYADPRNSYLNEVIDRRLGLPISLSVIFLEVGWRLRLPIAGVGMPGHFIVSVQGEDGAAYLDPFNGGRRLSLEDCTELVERATGTSVNFDPTWLLPTPRRDIVARMLNNLRMIYVSVEDWPMAIKICERLLALQPTVAAHLRDLGVLHYRSGLLRRASELLDQYLARQPDAPDVGSVRQGRNLLLEQLARLN
jgi:regulator of sirC expression with transglutaminase-like and TPR domain